MALLVKQHEIAQLLIKYPATDLNARVYTLAQHPELNTSPELLHLLYAQLKKRGINVPPPTGAAPKAPAAAPGSTMTLPSPKFPGERPSAAKPKQKPAKPATQPPIAIAKAKGQKPERRRVVLQQEEEEEESEDEEEYEREYAKYSHGSRFRVLTTGIVSLAAMVSGAIIWKILRKFYLRPTAILEEEAVEDYFLQTLHLYESAFGP